MKLLHFFDEAVGVLGACQLLAEGVQAEACVDALVQNAAQLFITLNDENVFNAAFSGGDGSGQPCRASADDGKLHLFHACTSLV